MASNASWTILSASIHATPRAQIFAAALWTWKDRRFALYLLRSSLASRSRFKDTAFGTCDKKMWCLNDFVVRVRHQLPKLRSHSKSWNNIGNTTISSTQRTWNWEFRVRWVKALDPNWLQQPGHQIYGAPVQQRAPVMACTCCGKKIKTIPFRLAYNSRLRSKKSAQPATSSINLNGLCISSSGARGSDRSARATKWFAASVMQNGSSPWVANGCCKPECMPILEMHVHVHRSPRQ